MARMGRPHLLAVDEEITGGGVALRAREDAGQIRAGGRLGIELAPHLGALERGAYMPLLVLGPGQGQQRGNAHAEADVVERHRHQERRFFLLEDDGLVGAAAGTAVLAREGDGAVARVELAALPCTGGGHAVILGQVHAPGFVGTRFARRVGFEPGAHLCTIGRVFRSIFEVHGVFLRPPRETRTKWHASRPPDARASRGRCRG